MLPKDRKILLPLILQCWCFGLYSVCVVDTDTESILLCRQDFIQLENETVFNEAVIEEREQGIREIHQQIGEVNEIFKDLAVLVHEQGYMIGT